MSRRAWGVGLLAAAALTLSAGCGSSTPPPSATATSGTATASVTSSAGPATVPVTGAELDVAAFKAAMAVPGTVVLDVRTPQEHATGFLANSVNIDVTAPDFSTRVAALDKSLPYAVFCRSGSRSKAAVAQLAAAGFTRVYHLGGGIQSWVGAGEPVVLP